MNRKQAFFLAMILSIIYSAMVTSMNLPMFIHITLILLFALPCIGFVLSGDAK